MQMHPAVRDLAAKMQLDYADAEHVLRGQAKTDQAAAAAVKEIDAAAAAEKAAAVKANADGAAALGLSPDQARDLVNKLAADPKLQTWLASRVNWTIAHGRPLADDE